MKSAVDECILTALLSSAPHRAEGLLALVPLVVSLPARLAVELDLFLVACATPELFLLHTTFGAVNIFITSTLLAALGEHVLGADTPRDSIPNSRVFLSCEPEEELLDFFVVFVTLAALPASTSSSAGSLNSLRNLSPLELILQ